MATGEPAARREAAEALERFGLLRRRRNGPSPAFVWMVTMALIVCAGAAVSMLGPAGGIAFAVVAATAGVLVLRRLRRPQGRDDVFMGPRGEEIPLPR